ncbi:MAG: hypothetical protein ACFFA0_04655 [Promethearchaeota archaeon]
MAQINTPDWMRHVPKLLRAGGIIAIISMFLPSIHAFESYGGYNLGFVSFFFGFYYTWISGGGYSDSQSGFIDEIFGDDLLGYGIGALALLLIGAILLNVGSGKARYTEDYKISAGTGLAGGLMTLIAPAVFYFGVADSYPGFFGPGGFDPSAGVYLPIIGGILGIIGGAMAAYAVSLGAKGGFREETPYQPTQVRPEISKASEGPSQQESPVFCKHCGTKLVGEFCQECGQRAEP